MLARYRSGGKHGLTCRQEDARHRALAEPQLLDHVVEVSWGGGESASAEARAQLAEGEGGGTHPRRRRAGM